MAKVRAGLTRRPALLGGERTRGLLQQLAEQLQAGQGRENRAQLLQRTGKHEHAAAFDAKWQPQYESDFGYLPPAGTINRPATAKTKAKKAKAG